jgi:hypothetical protein
MPLDNRKVAHLQLAINKTYANRQKTVVFVYQAGTAYAFSAISVIMRQLAVIEPQIPDSKGAAPLKLADTLMIAPIGVNFTGVLYIADTPVATAAAVLAATKYEVIEALPVGIIPSGTHIRAQLRKMR